MALTATVSVKNDGFRRINDMLRAVSPEQTPAIWSEGLTAMAVLVQRTVQKKTIVRGRGKNTKPHPTKISRRLGQLALSVVPDYAKLPSRVRIIAHAPYAAQHEHGLWVTIPGHMRSNANRSWSVRQYSAKYPQRPFMAPALELAEPHFGKIMINVLKKRLDRAS